MQPYKRHTQKRHRGGGDVTTEADWSDADTSQGTSGNTKARGEKEDSYPEPSEGAGPCSLISDFWPSEL